MDTPDAGQFLEPCDEPTPGWSGPLFLRNKFGERSDVEGMRKSSPLRSPQPRVTRREAAKILGTSYDNVRRMQRIGQLHSVPDRYGVHRFDRREVDALAKARALDVKPTPEKIIQAFKLFKAKAELGDVVLETGLLPHVVRDLHEQFLASYNYDKKKAREDDEARAQREHEEQLREMDRELARRRRATFDDEKKSDDE